MRLDEMRNFYYHIYEVISLTMRIFIYNPFSLKLYSKKVDARSSRLLPTGWRTEKDMHDKQADFGFTGLRSRAVLTERSKKAVFLGPIFADTFCQDRFLIPLTKIELSFTLSTWQFALRVNTAEDVNANYRFKIDKFKVLLNRVKVTPSVAARMEERLTKSPSLYPIRACNVRVFTIPQGAKYYECNPFGVSF